MASTLTNNEIRRKNYKAYWFQKQQAIKNGDLAVAAKYERRMNTLRIRKHGKEHDKEIAYKYGHVYLERLKNGYFRRATAKSKAKAKARAKAHNKQKAEVTK